MGIEKRTLTALVAFAKNSKLLALLDRPGLYELSQHAVVQDVPSGHVIVTQGDIGDNFYLLAEGEVSVRVREAGGKEVAKLSAGMFFGEIAVVTRQPRSATVVAITPSRLLCFPRAPLLALIRKYPELRSVISTVGLARSEENMRLASEGQEGDGLADLLEGDDESAAERRTESDAAAVDSAGASGADDDAAARAAEPASDPEFEGDIDVDVDIDVDHGEHTGSSSAGRK